MFERLLVDDGLTSVNAILKDTDGFVWFGGTHGLYRFDGYSFKLFRKSNTNTHSLSNNNVTSLYQDKEGYLWVGTVFGGVNKYNPINESFENVLNSDKSIYNTHHITAITKDNNGNLWYGTSENGLYRYNEGLNDVTNYTAEKGQISNNNIYSIAITNNNIWITSNSGVLDCFDSTIDRFFQYVFSEGTFNNTRTGLRICVDYKNNLWIGTEGRGLYKFDTTAKRFDLYDLNKPNALPVITDIREASSGEIWITTDGDGVIRYTEKTNSFTYFEHNSQLQNTISNNSQYSLYAAKNRLWVGMGDGSVNRTTNAPFEVFQSSNSNEFNSLSFNVITSLATKDNNLWVGTGGGKMSRFDTFKKTFAPPLVTSNNLQDIISKIVVKVWYDKVGTLWVANFKNGLLYKPKNHETFIKLKLEDMLGLDKALIFDIKHDKSNKLWIATYDKGLYIYNPKAQSLQKIHDKKLERSKLLSLCVDSKNNVWIGTASKGVLVYNQDNKTFETNTSLFSKISSLKNSPIKNIFEDSSKNIWIATEGSGLIKISTENTVENFNELDGLPSNSVYGLIQDNKGGLWGSSNRGIFYLKEGEGKSTIILNYDKYNGLPTNDFESGAIAKDDNGNLYFGSKNGLVYFSPEIVSKASSLTHLKITNLKVFNTDVSVNQEIMNQKPLDSSIVYKNKLILTRGLNNLTFEFAALGYEFPYNMKYEYQLSGFNDNWKEANNRSASYTNINPGKYVFKVRAFEKSTIVNEVLETQLEVIILPVWWQSNIAYLIYFSVLIWLIYFIYTNSKKRLRLKNELLIEKYKHEKDEELHQSKLNFFAAVSHEIRTSLTLVLTPLSRLSSSVEPNDTFNYLVKTMEQSGNRLLNLTNQVLNFRKMESKTIPLEVSNVDLSSFLAEISTPFKVLSEDKNIEFSTEIPKNCHGWVDLSKLEVILYNLLSNAFKFSATRVSLKATTEKKMLTIHIIDNGKGILNKNKDKIFDPFFQETTNENDLSDTGSGLGLAITKRLAHLHLGTVKIIETSSLSTSFSVTLPIGKEFYDKSNLKENEELSFIDYEKPNSELVDFDENSKNLSNEILLIVEDNSQIQKLIKHKFANRFQVITANNGKIGYQLALDTTPDIIISDIEMPILSGIKLCELIKSNEQTSHIPVILLTAYVSNNKKTKGFECGADDYVTKPFDLNLLATRVDNLLESRKLLWNKFQKQLFLDTNTITINDVDKIFIDKLLEIIKLNMDNTDFNIAKLSKEVGLSHSALYRKIKALTGESISEFLLSTRLKIALELLKKNTLTISEVGYMTGFSSPKYFSTCFKKKYGKRPSDLRRKNSV